LARRRTRRTHDASEILAIRPLADQIRYTFAAAMSQLEIAKNIVALYQRHDWKLQRVLLTPDLRREIAHRNTDVFAGAVLIDSEFDGLWFARPSSGKREAWELRLISEHAYALFEAFEADETEAERDDARSELEHRMRDYTLQSRPRPGPGSPES
jgi:hypothetical protein